MRHLVTFDWAMKKLLRSKANFDVLEGFLSELLREDVKIEELLESESNREADLDKSNRVDLLAVDAQGRRIIVEIQYERQDNYFQRMLYGTSRLVTENLKKGEPYDKVARVVSVNIVFFDLGQGQDYVYYGQTRFEGMHSRDTLELSDAQRRTFQRERVGELFPEYYILKVNNFNDIAKDGLDEWIYFLKNEDIKGDFHAKGLKVASKKLDVMRLSPKDQAAYLRYEDNLHQQASRMEPYARAEQAERQLEEARRREEELFATALGALMKTGMAEADARRMLGRGGGGG